MIKITDKAKCSGCHACYSACPKKCISMERDAEGFKYPRVDTDNCISCGLCEKACPIINPLSVDDNKKPASYAAFNKNEDVRMKSSSGGIFTLLAETVINKNGVVFGAAFNKDFGVEHIAAEKLEDLEKLRGSKYVQSNIGNSYKLAKEFLDGGRTVLFTGTPCQIGGLRSYLDKDYENLICQDIICHGVPAPAVWEKYKEYRTLSDGAKIRSISFRNKKFGWKAYRVSFEYGENLSYVQKNSDDPYMQVFLKNLCLRPSCHECSFKTLSRVSDITLADFWGIQRVMPEMDDDKGTSLVMIHSKKGADIFGKIKSELTLHEVDVLEAVNYNRSAIKAADKNPKRIKFMSEVSSRRFDKTAKKHLRAPFNVRCKRLAKRVIGKIIK